MKKFYILRIQQNQAFVNEYKKEIYKNIKKILKKY